MRRGRYKENKWSTSRFVLANNTLSRAEFKVVTKQFMVLKNPKLRFEMKLRSFRTNRIKHEPEWIKSVKNRYLVCARAPKNVQKNSLFFIFVDEFQKIIRCFLFPLIFSTNSTNQRNQRNEFNESTKKNFVDLTKFQRIFNENFNESTKISTNSTKISTNQRKFQRIQRKFQRINENFEKSTKISFVDSLNSLTNFQINIYSLI